MAKLIIMIIVGNVLLFRYADNHDWELDVLSALTYAMCTLIDFAYLLMYFPQ